VAGKVKRRHKKQQNRFSRPIQGVALAMLANQLFLPMVAQAGPPVIPGFYGKVTLPTVMANQLPQLKSGGLQSNASVSSSGSAMTITQTAARAIIDWDKFDIGVSASVYFSQKLKDVPQTSWAALNRIYDANPSQILGSLKADGRIYLLNQNGILFGPGSKVDVHTLVASSLKMDLQKLISTESNAYTTDRNNKTSLDIWSNPSQFLDETTSLNLTKFTRESWNLRSDNTQAPGAMVANAGTITSSGTTGEQGGVFLIGGAVENHGTISAPSGQIALVAGTEVYLSPAYSASIDTRRQGALTVKVAGVASGNDALNEVGAQLIADQGMVGMYGNRVTQNGLIRSISTVKRNGTIELLAKERITTGVGSVTATPVSVSPELVNRTFIYDDAGSFSYNTWITLAGLDQGSSPTLGTRYTDIAVEGIEHKGSIVAPGAEVLLQAKNRVFLDTNSLIDVSGSLVDLKVDDKIISTVLTSTELRDNQTQKYGITKGAEITTTTLSGSSIGNLSALTELQQATALQWTANAGSVEISASEGDIVMKGGAVIDISGGRVGYSSADIGQTMLVYGTRIYGIADAPQDLTYTRIMGDYTRSFERFGVEENYKGLWTGGANPLFNPLPAFEEGGNAGRLTLKARQLLLDGTINSSVIRGFFQTRLDEIRDSSGKALTRGLKMPDGGTLILGDYSYGGEADQKLDGVIIAGDTETQTDAIATIDEKPFSAAAGSMTTSVIGSRMLSLPGTALSDLQIYANSSITSTGDSSLSMLPGGSLTMRAQQITHNGSISVPSGTVNISLLDNIAVADNKSGNKVRVVLPEPSQVLLNPGSSISAAGLAVIDPNDTASLNYLDGGSISIKDTTEKGKGIIVQQGALLSVDAGYSMDAKRKVSGGDAGSLTLAGSSVDLRGTFSGKALVGNDSGTLKIHSNWMTLANQYRSTASGTVLGVDQLLESGFGNLDLTGVFGLTVEEGVRLPTTLARLSVNGSSPRLSVTDTTGLNGSTSLKLTAGKTLEYSNTNYISDPATDGGQVQQAADQALLKVGTGADLTIAPGGSIVLKGSAVELNGTLRSKAGKIEVTASGSLETARDLNIGSSALLDATGYNRDVIMKLGAVKFYETTPSDGGSISLNSDLGSVRMAAGALADVSGAEPVMVTVPNSDGLSVSKTVVAGSAGSLKIKGASLDLQGSLRAGTQLAGTRGGNLSITSQDALTLNGLQIGSYLASGFDALTFGSGNEVILSGFINQRIGRQLTLDSPLISGTDDSFVSLYAPWIKLTNSSLLTKTAVNGTGRLNLSGNEIDLSGSLALSGFSETLLNAGGDISATEIPVANVFKGELVTAGDLTMRAARVYPKNYAYPSDSFTIMIPSEFSIRSTGGSVTVLSSGGDTSGYLDSAGGSLSIEAQNGINQSGYLEAPLGRISLNTTSGNGRVYFAPGSTTSTAVGDHRVQVGFLDNDGKLALPLNGSAAITTTFLLGDAKDLESWRGTASGIYVNGAAVAGADQREVVQADGSLIDVSGGGDIFAYKFYPGAAGSLDPLKVSGRMVVVPQATAPLGGQTIYLAGGNGVAAGIYTVVPERYAFLPNAMVVSDAGGYVAPGSNNRTGEGYSIVAGYLGEANTAISSSRYRGYVVRSASEVLKEGEFVKYQLKAGNGGSVAINGDTILLDGAFRAQALAGYTGGKINLAGANMTVQNSAASTAGGIDFSSAIPSSLKGTVSVSSDALSGQGFKSVTLGSATSTETLTVAEGSNLAVYGDLTMQAKTLVEVKANSNLSGETLTLASPTGKVAVAEGAVLTGTKSVDFEVLNELDMQGTLNTALVNLAGENIVVNDGSALPAGVNGLSLSPTLWSTLNSFSPAIGLKSRNSLIFTGDTTLATTKDLTIDAARYAANSSDLHALISANALTLKNSGSSSTVAPATALNNTSLDLQANSISVDLSHPATGSSNVGDITVSGFKTTTLHAANDITLGGNGTLNSSGNLNLQAARVTTAVSTDRTYKNYLPANVLVQAANALAINQSVGTSGTSIVPGGKLAFKATDITQAGTIEMQSGTLVLDATNSLSFDAGSKTLNKGSASGAGGSIVATATNGSLAVAEGALLDVSAGSQGDSGSISLNGVIGGVTVGANTLKGNGSGTGGSFSIDSATFGDTATLLATLAKGGFTEQISLRGRTGDLTIADTDTTAGKAEILARKVSLIADGGSLTLEGQINTGSGKGLVELYANNDLTLATGSGVTVTGGGEANLGSSSGILTLAGGALLDLSDNGGTVNLRALQDTGNVNGVKMALNGEIKGASEVAVEAVKVYSGVSSITSANANTWKTATNTYMANANTYRDKLLSGLTMANQDALHFRPGVEVQSSGSMALNADLDLSSWRYTVNGISETGLLTLRAAGDLTLTKKISDSKTTRTSLHSSSMKDSWDLRLVAGASGANPLGVNKGSGKLDVTGVVYTENGDISFASGADTTMTYTAPSSPGYMINTSLKYNLASYGGSIRGEVGNNLTLNAGVIQSSVGDIDLQVAGNLDLNGSSTMGAIRTTGEAATTANMTKYYTYGNGGDLSVTVGGNIASNVSGTTSFNPWDTATNVRSGSSMIPYWHADYATSGGLRGIAAMAGGDVQVQAGGSVNAQIGSFAPTDTSGSGNLTVSASGNLDGRFLSGSGDALLSTQGAFGSDEERAPVVSAVYTKAISVKAQADLLLGTVDNPTISHPSYSTSYKKWNLTYLSESSLSLSSLGGDITMTGLNRFYSDSSNTDHGERRILPGSLSMQAAGDIILQNSFVLTPSEFAELNVTAGGDIDGSAAANSQAVGARLIMSDIDPSQVYGAQTVSPITTLNSYTQTHSTDLTLHRDTAQPVRVTAGGSIIDLELDLVKKAEISAGGSITDLHYVGQNIRQDDLTTITALGDITLNTAGLSPKEGVYLRTGFQHGGPGSFMVCSGGNVDLGSTIGIQTYGNHQNAGLAETGSDLYLLAGATKGYTASDISSFFMALKNGAQEYSQIKADGDAEAAAAKLASLRSELINPFIDGGLSQSGTLNMVASQVSTLTGNSINIMTGDTFNVGKSTFYGSGSQKNTGVYTALGGDINVFSRGDVNVNESRLMTFYGGDITVWSEDGVINAGRGSKAAINPSQSLKVMRDDGSYITRFSPPSVGSGVRAMTYDAGNGKTQPEAGDITLVARVVDAGEAGIFGNKVFLVADEVRNASNISSVGISVGVPVQTDSSAGIGSLSGSGSLNEGARMLVETTAMGSKGLVDKAALAAENFMTAWLDVKVMSFDENPPN